MGWVLTGDDITNESHVYSTNQKRKRIPCINRSCTNCEPNEVLILYYYYNMFYLMLYLLCILSCTGNWKGGDIKGERSTTLFFKASHASYVETSFLMYQSLLFLTYDPPIFYVSAGSLWPSFAAQDTSTVIGLLVTQAFTFLSLGKSLIAKWQRLKSLVSSHASGLKSF